jgi:hypothetical protein
LHIAHGSDSLLMLTAITADGFNCNMNLMSRTMDIIALRGVVMGRLGKLPALQVVGFD